jgi:hypothetical protein
VKLRILIAAAAALLAFSGTAYAQSGLPADEAGMFLVVCGPTMTQQIDPIVDPGMAMSAHMHTFFGHQGVTDTSTPKSIVGGPTACHLGEDSSAYWAPTAYRTDTGQQVTPKNGFAYYLGSPGQSVQPIPAGLEMIGGHPNGTAPFQLGSKLMVRFACNNGVYKTQPYDCRPYGSGAFVEAIVLFPFCWDGHGLTPNDVTYGDGNGVCPPGFPVKLEQLRLNEKYKGFQRGDLLRFSSGNAYTFHADFMNGWQESKLDSLTKGCLDTHRMCIEVSDKNPGP